MFLANELGNRFPSALAGNVLRTLEWSEMKLVWELLGLLLPRCGRAERLATRTLPGLSTCLASADLPASEVDGPREHLQQPLHHLE